MTTGKQQQMFGPGTPVGGYVIEETVGRGAMAVVYRALQVNLERHVALKILTPELARNAEFVVRFFNEARAAAALSHAHIVQAYDAGRTAEGICFFAMEYVEGETVLQRLKREGPLETGAALAIAADIAEALRYGWDRQRLTHGDIKPENIMINIRGETKLADFGLAKVEEHDFEGTDIMLTPLYAAPEMIRGVHKKGDCRADIYSFGATLYHMLAGTPPYPGDHPDEVMQRHLNEPLTPLERQRRGIRRDLSDCVGKMLEKNAVNRPQTWDEVIRTLKVLSNPRPTALRTARPAAPAAGRAGPVVRRPATRVPSRSRRSALVPAILLVILLGLLALLLKQLYEIKLETDRPGIVPAVPGGTVLTPENGNSTVPGSGEPVEPGVEATPDPAAQWLELKEALRSVRDPARCVDLLEEFGRTNEAQLPDDYDTLLEEYREAIELRRRTEEPPEDLRQPDPDAEAPADRQNRGARNAPPANVRDDYVEFLAEVGSCRYAPGQSTGALARAATAWLTAHPGDSPERAATTFLTETVLPALDDVIPRLIARETAVTGKTVDLPGRGKAEVVAVSPEALRLGVRHEHGQLVRLLPWTDPVAVHVLPQLSELAHAGTPPVIAEWRSHLALRMFLELPELEDFGLAALPDNPEKRQWQLLAMDLRGAVREAETVARWRDACRTYAAGAFGETYAALCEFETVPSAALERHRADVEAMKADCAPHVPSIQAANRVAEALECVGTDPERCVAILSTVVCRYGNADFPEKDRLREIRAEALTGLAGEEDSDLLVRQAFGAFLAGERGDPPLNMAAAAGSLAASGDLSPGLEVIVPAMEALGLANLGDWAGAREVLARLRTDPAWKSFPGLTGCVAYARGMTDLRLGGDDAAPDRIAAEFRESLAALPQGDPSGMAAPLACLAAEYALAAGDRGIDPDDFLAAEAVAAVANDRFRAKRRYVYLTAALVCRLKGPTAAAGCLGDILADDRTLAAHGFKGEETLFLSGLRAVLEGRAPGLAPGTVIPTRDREAALRALVMALASSGAVPDGAATARIRELCLPEAGGYGSAGGSALFDLCLLDVSRELRAGRPEAAIAVADANLGPAYACLSAFYPRLRFLRAGLLRLAGRHAEAREEFGLVRVASVASASELGLISAVETDSGRGRTPRRASRGAPVGFWHHWLAGTESPEKATDVSVAAVSRTGAGPAEMTLWKALTAFGETRKEPN